jgi:2-amino-4-hydroxy-6-hydroxymethyldihydropteridine diphosphokinase
MKLKENAQINRAYLSLGSNLGDKSGNLNKAIELLSERAGEVLAVSSFYETAPDGFISENSFVNIALSLDTKLDVYVLLDVCEEIEKELGRTTKSVNLNYSDRLIDIDILYFNNMQLATERLTLPHPRMHKRQFVLEPLAEIAPKLRHPITGMSTARMLKQIKS